MVSRRIDLYLYSTEKDKSKRASKDGYLEIRDPNCYHIQFEQSVRRDAYGNATGPGEPHEIAFVLNDAGLHFCSLDDERNPGIIWIGQDPGFVMVPYTNGNVLHITNRHFRDDTRGHWHYQLFAQNDRGDIYGIPWTSCNGRGDSNPSIKNV